jgi:hypothetical protein
MDQTLLLEESWAILFLLSLAQWSVQIDEGEFCIFTAAKKIPNQER